MTKYQMRKLKTKDIFKFSKVLSKIEMDFTSIKTDGLNQSQAGIAIMKLVFENLHKAEDEVAEFIGDLVGLTGEEFSDLEFEDTLVIMEQFKNIKGLDTFFKSATAQAEKK